MRSSKNKTNKSLPPVRANKMNSYIDKSLKLIEKGCY